MPRLPTRSKNVMCSTLLLPGLTNGMAVVIVPSNVVPCMLWRSMMIAAVGAHE